MRCSYYAIALELLLAISYPDRCICECMHEYTAEPYSEKNSCLVHYAPETERTLYMYTFLTTLYTDCLEYIKSTEGSGKEHPRQLWVPVQFLDLGLALVNEEQLWRNVARYIGIRVLRRVFILLYCQVPLNNLARVIM